MQAAPMEQCGNCGGLLKHLFSYRGAMDNYITAFAQAQDALSGASMQVQ